MFDQRPRKRQFKSHDTANHVSQFSTIGVIVFEPVIERIKEAISSSSLEVGGKLLGRIRRRGQQLVVQVETFIDSGPGATMSNTHLYPNGEYQENIFRVAEKFDPEIEHIGSWHSHHPNGLHHLSGGDIQGYSHSVNDKQYGLDHFLALLAIGICNEVPVIRYFLFTRGEDSYQELDPQYVEIVPRHHKAEILLADAERLSTDRLPGAQAINHSTDTGHTPSDTLLDPQTLRAQDNRWLKQQGFEKLRTLRDLQTGAVYWRWVLTAGSKELTIRYLHPHEAAELARNEAVLQARLGDKFSQEVRVALNEKRFEVITNALERWRKSLTPSRLGFIRRIIQ